MVSPFGQYSKPASTEALVAVMRRYRTVPLTWQEVIHDYGEGDLQAFYDRYFRGKEKLELGDLSPYVLYHTLYWLPVSRAVVKILQEQSVIDPQYVPGDHLQRPSTALPWKYYSKRNR